MIFLIFFSFLSLAREFPEKEMTRRCDQGKIQACIDENQRIVSQLEAEERSLANQIDEISSEYRETQKLLEPILENLESNRINLHFVDKMAKKTVEKEKNATYGPIFSDGPNLFDLKRLQIPGPYGQTKRQDHLIDSLTKESHFLREKVIILENESRIFSNKIQSLDHTLREKKGSLQHLQTLKHQHVLLCEFGCKTRFCPEN